ncbi:MAG: hypothetical protein KatS3mg105_3182 [Gemmatales bacterium]|nr:MAG: hypothetical protein KatS3mg105_3182 [Gemmatales bacterium]
MLHRVPHTALDCCLECRRLALVLLAVGAIAACAVAQEKTADRNWLPAPPFEIKFLPGWRTEHLAFSIGQNGRSFGGPARWAVGGSLPLITRPVEQADTLYLGKSSPGIRLYFRDKRRVFWKLEGDEIWPIAGGDDLGDSLDGPGEFAGFLGPGVYGGGYFSVAASGHTLFINDNGLLRRLARRADGSWHVETVAGRGKRSGLPEGKEAVLLNEFGRLGKGLAMDPKGNLYLAVGGGLAKADPAGRVTTVITQQKASQDLAAVYAKKWPKSKPRQVNIGSGEGVHLIWHTDGSIYIGGRCWPDAAKVTPDGTYVPLAGYAPPEATIKDARWGMGDPARYQVHCSFGFAVDPRGNVLARHEIPSALSRYLRDRVEVLQKDGTWGVGKEFLDLHYVTAIMDRDGVWRQAGPAGPYPSRTAFVRIRKVE